MAAEEDRNDRTGHGRLDDHDALEFHRAGKPLGKKEHERGK